MTTHAGTGAPQKHKNHLRLNKLATLGANNFLGKRDASNLELDSEHLAKSKLEYKFSALYLLPKKSYGLSKSEKITVATRKCRRGRSGANIK